MSQQKLQFTSRDIEALYKSQAKQYSDFANDSFSWIYLEKPLLDNALKPYLTKDSKVLDAGCGMGRTLKYLLDKKIPAKNILGIDISNEMLAISNKHVPEVNTVKSDLSKLNPKGRFDIIICTHVLHYLNDSGFSATLRNFYKLLNGGGVLVFVITHPVRTTRHNLSEYFKRDWIVDHTP